MAPATRMRRTVRWLAGAGMLALPACAAVKTEPPERFPLPPSLASRATPANPGVPLVVPAAAQVRPGDEKPAPQKAAFAGPAVPAASTQGKPLPIDLPTALTLDERQPARHPDRGRASCGPPPLSFDRAKVLWLPNLALGVDYFRHDGQIQDVVGNVFNTSKSSFLLGAGPTAVFSVGDACYAPLAARQIVRARQADVQAVRNDTTLQVAEAYFTVQQARGEVAGSIDALRRAEELVKLTEKVAPDLAPTVEVNRAKTEAARRRQAVEAAYERWQVASADLDPPPAARTRHAGRTGRGACARRRADRPGGYARTT